MNTPGKLILTSIVFMVMGFVYVLGLPSDWEKSDISPTGYLMGTVLMLSIPMFIVGILWEIWIL